MEASVEAAVEAAAVEEDAVDAAAGDTAGERQVRCCCLRPWVLSNCARG